MPPDTAPDVAALAAFIEQAPDNVRKQLQQVLSVVAMQAAAIDDLAWKLDIQVGGGTEQRRINGEALTQLAARLQQPVVQGPTLDEVTTRIREMNEQIRNAATAQQAFQTILAFALKVAPLAV